MLTGLQLKMLRIKKKVNQSKIANDLGVTRNFISMVENSHRHLNEEQYRQFIDSLYKHSKANVENVVDEATEEVEEIKEIEIKEDKKQATKTKQIKTKK